MARTGRIWVLAALVAAVSAVPAAGSTFSNPALITVPEPPMNGALVNPGKPYPSAIGVTGLPGTVVRARATLHGVSHTLPSEIDALLVAPSGSKTILMSDACGANGLNGETFTFDDAATVALTVSAASCAGKSGTYTPTDGPPADSFSSPAPPGPYPVALSALNGAAANGVWQLFVVDDASGDDGSISGGWSLELLPDATCGGKSAAVAGHVGTAGNDVITGTPGADVILGLGGSDTIKGLGGNDVICGGDGKDILVGGPGKDILKGQRGRDRLKGQGGKDRCVGGPKPDTAKGCERRKSI